MDNLDVSLAERSSEFIEYFGFGLPLVVPIWRSAQRGAWEVVHYPRRMTSSAYVSQVAVDQAGVALRRDGVTWMNFSLLERESHAWHLHRATGTVLVGGLGLGMFVAAAASKPEVDRVIVVESDSEVVALFESHTDYREAAWGSKVTILTHSVLSQDLPARLREAGVGDIDYLYMDIWPDYPSANARCETADVVHRVRPRDAGWWGQEAGYGQWCEMRRRPISEDSLIEYISNSAIPSGHTAGYLAFCSAVAEAHGLDLVAAPPQISQGLERREVSWGH